MAGVSCLTESKMAGVSFFQKVTERAQAIDSLLCIGLDPHSSELGATPTSQGALEFCLRLIAATVSFGVSEPCGCVNKE